MINLSNDELAIAKKIKELKKESGSHSPSIFTFAKNIPELDVKIDACFLSNPYATNLFIDYLKKDLIETGKLRDYMEFYPSQNNVIAESISESINISSENIFVGNGAIEIIQAVMHNFVENKIIVNIPTFSSYYEFANPQTKVFYHQLDKDADFILDPNKYLEYVNKINPDSLVIINPNNPDGSYLKIDDLEYLIKELQHIKNIIIDESFIHFAYDDDKYELKSATDLFKQYSNLIIIKSMSKDFGIAGIRAGYGIMDKNKVDSLLSNGYLWNSSGLSEYFFQLYRNEEFFKKYNEIRKNFILETKEFYNELSLIKKIRVFPTKANFALVELIDGSSSANFVSKLLIKYGIYVRTGDDKIGLDGQFARIASRTKNENQFIIQSLRKMFK